MARLRSNFQRGSLSSSITSGATSIPSGEFSALPVVASPDFLIIVLDPEAVHGNPEIVKVTAHTSSSTTVTGVRGMEGTTARAHNPSTVWRHVPSSKDWQYVDDVYDVDELGAAGDGVTSDQSVWEDAIGEAQTATASSPYGQAIVRARSRKYLVTGLTVDGGNALRILGNAGLGPLESTGDYARAATMLVSATNSTVLKLTDSDKTSLQNAGTSVENIAILGSSAAGSSQHGITVDQRLAFFRNVMVAGCGGRGWNIYDSVGGSYENCFSWKNTAEGVLIDPTAGSGSGSAVTVNTFSNLTSFYNGSHGLVIQGTAWGNFFAGGFLEGNNGYGLVFDVVTTHYPRFNRGIDIWIENNVTGSVHVADVSVQDNEFEFSRVDATPVFAVGAYRRNEFTYSDLSLSGAAQRRVHQIGVQRSNGGLGSSDMDVVVDRNFDDSGDGARRLRRLYLSGDGSSLGPADVTPSATPCVTSYPGSPENHVAAPPGSYCADQTNGEGYIKNTGTGNTGWKLITHA